MAHLLPEDKKLHSFYAGIDKFTEIKLTYSGIPSSKIIADPILGYIYLKPLEVALIDTELFQRLRHITQTGLAYLVFPTLSYSRFEHSIGVLGRVNQLLLKIRENATRLVNNKFINNLDTYEDAVRLAALMHDIGHCMFSHCSERVIEQIESSELFPSSQEIKCIFKDFFKTDKSIGFAEIFTVSILGSMHFEKFIIDLDLYKKHDVKNMIKTAIYFILGLPDNKNPKTLFLAQLISSGFDADKIDYMTREQHYTGIKIELDMDRIFSSINIFSIKADQLPKNQQYLKKIFKPEDEFLILGFSKGGQFLFEEFCVARLALNLKIYLHQKVRASEAQLSYLLHMTFKDKISEDGVPHPMSIAYNWLYIPEVSIQYPDMISEILYTNKDKTLFSPQKNDILNTKTKEALKSIYKRVLPVRAFGFGFINEVGRTAEDAIQHDIGALLCIDVDEKSVKNDIIKEAKSIAEILATDCIYERLQDDNNKLYHESELDSIFKLDDISEENILIDIPKYRFKNIQQGHETLFFEKTSKQSPRWTIPIDKIVPYYESNRAIGYIFAKKSISPIVYLATEIVFLKKFKKSFSQEDIVSKALHDLSLFIKKILNKKKYYEKYSQIKPLSDVLILSSSNDKIKQICNNLQGFESFEHERITESKVVTFVNQFQEDIQEDCLDFLTHIKLYRPNNLVNIIKKAIEENKNTAIGLSFLGNSKDSGSRLTYDLRIFFEENNIEPLEINESLILHNDCLIIYDDNANSGLQILNTFAELLGEQDSLKDMRLDETHAKTLIGEAKEKLKTMKLYFCFIVGSEGIEEKIRNLLSEKLAFDKNNIKVFVHEELRNAQKILSGANSQFNAKNKVPLKNFLEDIGTKLMQSNNKDYKYIKHKKLGYADAEAMIFFPYNIPTMTITALWMDGDIGNGIPWIPLAKRRRRTKNNAKE